MKLIDFIMVIIVLVVIFLIFRQPDTTYLEKQNERIALQIDSLKKSVEELKALNRNIDTIIIKNNYHYIKEVQKIDTVKTIDDINAIIRAKLNELSTVE